MSDKGPIDRTALAAAIAEVALLRGQFTLRSGRTSSYYLDKYLFSTRPELLGPIGDLLGARVAQLEADLGPVHRLAGAELGGIPLVTAASLRTGKACLFLRNQKKDYGTAKLMEGVLQEGERVAFVEDVATSGGQAIESVGVLREAGAEVVAVVCVIDRQEGAREAIEKAGVRFEALFTKSDLGIDE
jgi:orotate phosphoribosyltransferase